MTSTKKQNVVWRTCPDYPFIQANQFGEIRTLDHYTTYKDGRKGFFKGRVLKQQLRRDGYMQVCFCVNGKRFSLLVHRIVALCFLQNPDNLPEVNHIDCNRANNSVNNLEFCTSQYNNIYREKYGKAFGRPLYAVKLKTLEVLFFESQREAARQLGINQRSISNVIREKQKTTGGYWFCYVNENAIENIRSKFGDEVASQLNQRNLKKVKIRVATAL